MKFDNSQPIYLQVVTEIKKDIVTGKIKPGDKLPSGRDLAAMYVINPNTSTRVYQVLEQEGIAYTKRGMGTYVKEDSDFIEKLKSEMAKSYVTYFKNNMQAIGIDLQGMIALLEKEEKKDA